MYICYVQVLSYLLTKVLKALFPGYLSICQCISAVCEHGIFKPLNLTKFTVLVHLGKI